MPSELTAATFRVCVASALCFAAHCVAPCAYVLGFSDSQRTRKCSTTPDNNVAHKRHQRSHTPSLCTEPPALCCTWCAWLRVQHTHFEHKHGHFGPPDALLHRMKAHSTNIDNDDAVDSDSFDNISLFAIELAQLVECRRAAFDFRVAHDTLVTCKAINYPSRSTM